MTVGGSESQLSENQSRQGPGMLLAMSMTGQVKRGHISTGLDCKFSLCKIMISDDHKYWWEQS